jgi:hypothetical protein
VETDVLLLVAWDLSLDCVFHLPFCVEDGRGGGVSGDEAGQPNHNATNLTWNRIEADAEDILLREEEDVLMGTPHLLEVTQSWS